MRLLFLWERCLVSYRNYYISQSKFKVTILFYINATASAGLGPTFPSNNPLLASAGLSGLTLGGSLVGPLAGMAGMTGSSLGGFGLGIGGASLASPTSNVIMVTNLPLGIDEEQVRELVATFGEVIN